MVLEIVVYALNCIFFHCSLSVHLSIYISYVMIGLVFTNMICMTINCWKNCVKGGDNRRKYKVVSMRSDAETDVEC